MEMMVLSFRRAIHARLEVFNAERTPFGHDGRNPLGPSKFVDNRQHNIRNDRCGSRDRYHQDRGMEIQPRIKRERYSRWSVVSCCGIHGQVPIPPPTTLKNP